MSGFPLTTCGNDKKRDPFDSLRSLRVTPIHIIGVKLPRRPPRNDLVAVAYFAEAATKAKPATAKQF